MLPVVEAMQFLPYFFTAVLVEEKQPFIMIMGGLSTLDCIWSILLAQSDSSYQVGYEVNDSLWMLSFRLLLFLNSLQPKPYALCPIGNDCPHRIRPRFAKTSWDHSHQLFAFGPSWSHHGPYIISDGCPFSDRTSRKRACAFPRLAIDKAPQVIYWSVLQDSTCDDHLTSFSGITKPLCVYIILSLLAWSDTCKMVTAWVPDVFYICFTTVLASLSIGKERSRKVLTICLHSHVR